MPPRRSCGLGHLVIVWPGLKPRGEVQGRSVDKGLLGNEDD